MAERRTHPNGGVYERGPDGQWHLVSQSPVMGPAIGNDPRIPGSLQGQALQNQNTAVNARVNQATEAAQVRQANAQATKAENEARISNKSAANPGFDYEQKLRGEFQGLPQVKQYTEAANSLSGMLKAPNTPQGDLQVVYAFAKIMDPGSVVREGEMDMATNTASIVENLERQYGRLSDGNRLPPAVRQGLIESARQKMGGLNATYGQAYKQYRDLAVQNGVDPERVTGPYAGDVVSGKEADYIRSAGGSPRSALADPNADFRTENNPERSAFIDSMVRTGVPFDQAQKLYKERFPEAPVFEDRGEWNKAVQFAKKFPGSPGSFGQSLDQVPLNQTEQDRNWLGQTTPGQVATLYANAAAGGIPSALAGQEGQQTVQGARDDLGGFSLVPEVAGAITGTLGVHKALGGLSNIKPFNFLANNPQARMLGADIGYGGLYGGTQNPDNPIAGAAMGAGAGLAGNVIGRSVVAPGIRAGANALGFNAPRALSPADNMVAGQTLKADPEQVMGRMQEAVDLRMPFTLADADPRLRALGGSVVRKSPDAYAFADNAIGSRAGGQQERALGLINTQLAPAGDINAITAAATKRAQAGSKDLYDAAMRHAAPDDVELGEILRSPTMERVARDAYETALNKGENPAELSFEVDSITGQTRIAANPNWRTLQYMKFGLDKMAGQGGDSSLKVLQRRFNTRLSRLNPDFRQANKAYADVAKQGSAAQAGYGATKPGVMPPQVGSQLGSMKPDQLPYFQQGYASSLADTVGNTRLATDPYERIYGSPNQQQKLGMVFPEGAPRFAQARGLERNMSETTRELFGGSPTQPRAEADKLFEGGLAEGAMDLGLSVASGTPPINAMRAGLFAGRSGFGGLKDAWKLGMGKSAKEKADKLAPLLFNPNSEEVLAQLGDLLAAKRARDAYIQRTGMFGSGIGAPLAIGAYTNN